MREVEAKFILSARNGAEAALRALASRCELRALTAEELRDHYLHDASATLLRAGLACRRRVRSTAGGEHRALQLKTLSNTVNGAVQVREETTQPLEGDVSGALRPGDLPDGPVQRELQRLGVGKLRVGASLFTQRDRFAAVTFDGAELMVCVDRSLASDARGDVVLQFCELELELERGPMAALIELADHLESAGFTPSRLSKFQRSGWQAGMIRPPKVARCEPDDPVAPLMLAQFSRWRARAEHYGAVAQEGTDPRGVHLTRTSLRRIRGLLKLMEPYAPSELAKLNRELGEIAREAGQARDLHVLEQRLDARIANLECVGRGARGRLLERLLQEQATAAERASRALVTAPALFAQCEQVLRGLDPDTGPTCREFALQQVMRRHKQLHRAGERLSRNAPDAVFHEVRLRAKKLRYAAQLLRPAYPFLKSVQKQAQLLQVSFGTHQDACITLAHLRSAAEEMPAMGRQRAALVLAGRLIQGELETRRAARERALDDWKDFAAASARKQLKRRLRRA